ncbi:MAG: M1 family metallopeptidase [bacterium]|nr:M1 family metallopeptidase [bacterium]
MHQPTSNSPFVTAMLMALLTGATAAQGDAIPEGFTRQDQLRGSITPERAWWDVKHYDLALAIYPATKSIAGHNTITFEALAKATRMQIDLQPPLKLTKAMLGEEELPFEREGKVYWLTLPAPIEPGTEAAITVHYEGRPRQSTRPPWSGGFSWRKDSKGQHFIATTCQGIGASIWWPNKDHGADEPDRGIDMHFTVPDGLVAVANGRLQSRKEAEQEGRTTFHWRVTNPINNYSVNVNIGNYVPMRSKYDGEGGKLDVEYWVLEHQREQAKKQFVEVPRTLAAFEHWFGKYPFYEDSYKLVVVPYLGMEHQSSVTYGNGFQNGYLGRDLSNTGVGMKFDFIVVHESAHEWWGNNISMRDAADMWIHESFANYAENLFVEYHFTAKEAQDYVIGCRALVQNDIPIIGVYGVNKSGSGDMYYKGGNMLHTMRHMLDDDTKWRAMLRGVNAEFWHQTVTTADFEAYVCKVCDFDFTKVFDQYLRTTDIPVLVVEPSEQGQHVTLRFEKVVEGFTVPVVVRINGKEQRVTVSDAPTKLALKSKLESFELDRNFYMTVDQR